VRTRNSGGSLTSQIITVHVLKVFYYIFIHALAIGNMSFSEVVVDAMVTNIATTASTKA